VTAPEFTTRERQQLGKLAGEIYETELGLPLEDLAGSFDQWRAGNLLASELSQAIPEFHQGSRVVCGPCEKLIPLIEFFRDR
jgi:hypothetical protein